MLRKSLFYLMSVITDPGKAGSCLPECFLHADVSDKKVDLLGRKDVFECFSRKKPTVIIRGNFLLFFSFIDKKTF